MRAGDWRGMGDFTDLLGLDKLLDTFVRRLSLGQRMRADIAATLLHRPWVLFLDEPTAGLDVVAKAQVRDFLSRMNRDLTFLSRCLRLLLLLLGNLVGVPIRQA